MIDAVPKQFTAFVGDRRLASGPLDEVARVRSDMGLVIEDSRDGGNGYARLRGEVADCRALAARPTHFVTLICSMTCSIASRQDSRLAWYLAIDSTIPGCLHRRIISVSDVTYRFIAEMTREVGYCLASGIAVLSPGG